MSEKLCLKWNDFQENVNTAFGNLRGNNNFSDVTLACEDGQQFETHKLVLAASSPIFQKLLERNKHPHPLIYMRGLKSEDLSAIIDFLYFGEANVFQENLDSFLTIADELKLKGLMGQTCDLDEENPKESNSSSLLMPIEPKVVVKSDNKQPSTLKCADQQLVNIDNNFDQIMTLTKYATEDLQELDEQVKSMMENSQNMVQEGKQRKRAKICKACGKEGNPTAIKDHIEANHLDGVSLPCNNCEKTFRSRIAKRMHKCKSYTLGS